MNKLQFLRYLPARIRLIKAIREMVKREGVDLFASALFSRQKTTPLKKVRPGINRIVVKTIHFGLQPMIMEKGIPVTISDGTRLYVNVFRPEKQGRYPVVMSADIYGKDPVFQGIKHIEGTTLVYYLQGREVMHDET